MSRYQVFFTNRCVIGGFSIAEAFFEKLAEDKIAEDRSR
jgi:hypothetical protein